MTSIRPRKQCPAFVLMLVLGLFALVTGAAAVLSLHSAQFVRADRDRAVEIELGQLIDSGVAYAQLHRGALLPQSAPVLLDAGHLAPHRPSASISITPIPRTGDASPAVTVQARITLRPGSVHSKSIRVELLPE